ncbi:hypothetical protein D1007_57967 [Hordeum vulgare]|nr:heavy metal-associated isoprenylated plant protein 35-like [Hordeum vulgare subsp. vulgare]KAE8770313.1 hypothetical protein D1007_57967 [Hordeum vulgare]
MASGQPAVQTFVLRVTIHCHGCKKKVRKVLKSIEGVHDVKVDAQQHKVMVTGTVDAETLVKRLHKSGKQALPWQHTPAKNPEPAPSPSTPTDAPAPAEDGSNDAAVADKKPAVPAKEPQTSSSDKKPEQETSPEKKPEMDKEAEPEKKAEKEEAKPSDESKKAGGEGAAAEPKAKGTEPAETTKEAGNNEGEGKKKQSKPKDADRSLPPAPAHVPRHPHHEFNPYNAPQPVMSYNMAQPRASVSHYAPQPEQGYSQPQAGYSSMTQHSPAQQAYSQHAQPMQQWSPSYLYMPYPHASPESYYQDYYSPPGTNASPPPPPPLHDSYSLFDDENPNSCSVM